MRIATWNVNSIGARLPRLNEWLELAEPDVLCLQETKCAGDVFPGVAGRFRDLTGLIFRDIGGGGLPTLRAGFGDPSRVTARDGLKPAGAGGMRCGHVRCSPTSAAAGCSCRTRPSCVDT